MKRLLLLSVALLTVWAAAAQVRFVDATELNLIGKALPTPHPYHRIDTVAYKGDNGVRDLQKSHKLPRLCI